MKVQDASTKGMKLELDLEAGKLMGGCWARVSSGWKISGQVHFAR